MCDVTKPHRDFCVNFRNSHVTQADSHGDFNGRHYEQQFLEQARCGKPNTGGNAWTVFVNMGDAWGDPQHRQTCPSEMSQGFAPRGSWQHQVSYNNNATWIPCNWDGSGGWDYAGCCIAEWGEGNKESCCDPKNPEMDVQKCDPSWCPFSPDCEKAQSTANWCRDNPTDENCMNICKQYTTYESVKNNQRPDWCDPFVQKYCTINEFSKDSTVQSFCSCINTPVFQPECLSATCTSSANAWRSPQQLERINSPDGCGNICAQIVDVSKNQGAGKVDGNYFSIKCPGQKLPTNTTTNTSSSPSSTPPTNPPPSSSNNDDDDDTKFTPPVPKKPSVDPQSDPNAFSSQVVQHPIVAYTNLFAIDGWWKTKDGWIGISIIIGLLIVVYAIIKLISSIFSSSPEPQLRQQRLSPSADVSI